MSSIIYKWHFSFLVIFCNWDVICDHRPGSYVLCLGQLVHVNEVCDYLVVLNIFIRMNGKISTCVRLYTLFSVSPQNGETAMSRARAKGHKKIVKLLQQYKV